MSLRIQDLTLANFRSYSSFTVSNLGELTIFHGPNAVGKTNVVEAIQLLTALTSFRKASAAELVMSGATQARVAATITDGNRLLDLALTFDDGKRAYHLNGKPRSVKSLKGMVPSIIFSPEDLSLIKGSDSFRRQELDQLGAQVNANYYQITRDFEKVLRQRNRLLKDEAAPNLLDSLTEVFAKVGAQLTAYRKAMLTRIIPHIMSAYADISGGEQLTVEYHASWDETLDLVDALHGNREQERARKTTLLGPHRDHILFQVNGMNAGSFASQGQQRSIVLAVKMAEVQLIEEMLDQKPILLLDDVMSELDASRRAAMVEKLLPDTQTFITTANLDYFNKEIIEKARIIRIERPDPHSHPTENQIGS